MAQRVIAEPDYLIRGTLEDPALRFSLARTTDTVTTGILVHDTDPVAASLFGRCLTAAVLLAPQLEGAEKFMIRWEYEAGPVGSILVDVNAEAQVRGIPRETHLMEKARTERELYGGDGRISVLKSDEGRVINSGTAEARLLDVVDDLAFFLSVSDQVETEIITSLSFRADPENPVAEAGGLLLQAMPGCDLSHFERLRHRARDPELKKRLGGEDAGETRLERLFDTLLDGTGTPSRLRPTSPYVHSAPRPAYACSCSRDKMRHAVSLLGRDDIRAMFEKNDAPRATCEFCNATYVFRRSELLPEE